MLDLYLGVLLVLGAMALIFFGPELGKKVSRKLLRRRARRRRAAFRRAQRVRTRKVVLEGHFAPF